MKRHKLNLRGVVLATSLGLALPVVGGPETTQLKATIEQWMSVQGEVQKEEARWEREKVILRDAKEGLESELAQLDEELKEVQIRIEGKDVASQEKLAEKRSFDEAREAFAAELDGLEEVVEEVLPLIPEFFVKESSKLEKSIIQLKKHLGSDDRSKVGLNARLSPLVQILTEIERFNQKIWPVDEVLDVDGAPKKMRVAYFGLGVAYAVNSETTVALRGRPSGSGWVFARLEGEEFAAEVRDLIGSVDNSGEAKMVTLPLTISN